MYYVSIDNDYHFELATKLIDAAKLDVREIIFISHISIRNTKIVSSEFRRIEIIGHPLSSGAGYKNPLVYLRSIVHKRRMRKLFDFRLDDVLLLMTEYQLNNAVYAKMMKKNGGKVYLFDDGIGFYLNNFSNNLYKPTWIDRPYLLAYNFIYYLCGVPAIARKGFEGRMFAAVMDGYVDTLFVRFKVKLNRKIRTSGYCLGPTVRTGAKSTESVALFLANNLRVFGVAEEEMQLSGQAIRQLSEKFDRVYLKIHPHDYLNANATYCFYKEIAGKFSNITLVSNLITSNESVDTLNPDVIVGMLGPGMYDALLVGHKVIFLFHLLPRPEKFRLFSEVSATVLLSMKYRFIGKIDDIEPRISCQEDFAAFRYCNDILF